MASFRSYERLIPPDRLPNTATIERDALVQALVRLKAVSADGCGRRAWYGMPAQPSCAFRFFASAMSAPQKTSRGSLAGSARVAVSLAMMLELCEELDSETLLLECDGLGAIRVTAPDDAGMLILQMPLRWSVDEINAEAA